MTLQDPEVSDLLTPSNFLALPPELSSFTNSEFVLIPVPYDGTTTYRTGARLGPQAIIQASHELEDFDPELEWEPSSLGIHTADQVSPHSGGPKWMVERVEKVTGHYLDAGKRIGLLGGEHSIAIGSISAARKRFSDLSVLYLDAHADFRESYQESRFSHACTARRVREICPIILAGVRSISSEEFADLTNMKVSVFPRESEPLQEQDHQDIIQLLSSHVYISIDTDVLDPSLVPSVGNPEPGGMGWWELLGLLRAVASSCKIVGFDVTELSPQRYQDTSAYVMAKLVYKLISYSLFHQAPR